MTLTDTPASKKFIFSHPGSYTFDFKVFHSSDVKVIYTDDDGVSRDLVYPTEYTIEIRDDIIGGTCVVSASLPTGQLEIKRDLPYSQETDWVNNDPFDMETLELTEDRIVMLIQQVKSSILSSGVNGIWKGTWQTGVSYKPGELVRHPLNHNIYICLSEHTSGGSFVEPGYWAIFFDASSLSTVPVTGYVADESALIPGTQNGQQVICLSNSNRYLWNSADSKWSICSGNNYTSEDLSGYRIPFQTTITRNLKTQVYNGTTQAYSEDLWSYPEASVLTGGFFVKPRFKWISSSTVRLSTFLMQINSFRNKIVKSYYDINFVFGPSGSNPISDPMAAYTWYYLYTSPVYLEKEVLEAADLVSRTVYPEWSDNKKCWAFPNRHTQRYLGAFFTDSVGGIKEFYHSGNYVQWGTEIPVETFTLSTTFHTTPAFKVPNFVRQCNVVLAVTATSTASVVRHRPNGTSGNGQIIIWSDTPTSTTGRVTLGEDLKLSINANHTLATTQLKLLGYYLPEGM